MRVGVTLWGYEKGGAALSYSSDGEGGDGDGDASDNFLCPLRSDGGGALYSACSGVTSVTLSGELHCSQKVLEFAFSWPQRGHCM